MGFFAIKAVFKSSEGLLFCAIARTWKPFIIKLIYVSKSDCEFPLSTAQYHLLDSPSPHRIPIRKHHIRISFVVPPCKYINTQPILLLYLCCSVILICINAFSISIIHAGYNMHILLLPVHHRKDKNLLPAPALDLTVFCIFPGLYLM